MNGEKRNVRLSLLKSGLILAVFALFLSSAVGLLELNLVTGVRISINSLLTHNSGLIVERLASADIILFIIIGMVLAIVLPVTDHLRSSLVTFICILLAFALHHYALVDYRLIPLTYLLLMVLILYIVNVLISYFMEIHQKQKILETMGRYLPPHIVDAISKSEDAISLEAEARELTVMFCDIQNFTKISEELNPKQLAALLNEYFTALTRILYRYNATIDKFIGDSIMAFWGAPLPQNDHAEIAVLAALAMQQEINRLSGSFIEKGWPGPTAGFGINTGLMAVGNMGSIYRVAYTVIGDAVNIASRIESLTDDYQVPVIVTGSTMKKCSGILFRELDRVILKGKRKPTRIYQPLCIKTEAGESLAARLEKHNEGLSCYYQRQYNQAMAIFRELREQDSNDKYYSGMIDKIESRRTSEADLPASQAGGTDLDTTTEKPHE